MSQGFRDISILIVITFWSFYYKIQINIIAAIFNKTKSISLLISTIKLDWIDCACENISNLPTKSVQPSNILCENFTPILGNIIYVSFSLLNLFRFLFSLFTISFISFSLQFRINWHLFDYNLGRALCFYYCLFNRLSCVEIIPSLLLTLQSTFCQSHSESLKYIKLEMSTLVIIFGTDLHSLAIFRIPISWTH